MTGQARNRQRFPSASHSSFVIFHLASGARGDEAPRNMAAAPRTFTVYFGGELFNAKHLLGNAMLAEAIHHRSRGKYQPLLPQDLEQRETTLHSIRDQDIRALLACDLGLFNYDGCDLDSGTVVEFMMAKFADIPSVLLRTDFRHSGDHAGVGDPWNLMSSFYPRTKAVTLDSLGSYQKGLHREEGGSLQHVLEANRSSNAGLAMIQRTADLVIDALDAVAAMPSVLPARNAEAVYEWLAHMPGFQLPAEQSVGELHHLLRRKRERGLLS